MIGLEEMRAAFDALAAAGVMTTGRRDDFVESIDWLIARIETALPTARQFVRPGFDEPDEVARLEGEEKDAGR